jgi:general secretion pathway protein C
MQSHGNRMLGARAVTFALSALVAASAVYWGLQWGGTQASAPTATPPNPAATAAPDPQAIAKALGGGMAVVTAASASPAASANSRLTLVGVVADAHSTGVALISVDGKPAKPFRVGATVDGRLVLQSVGVRKAALGTDRDTVAQMVLELPALPK